MGKSLGLLGAALAIPATAALVSIAVEQDGFGLFAASPNSPPRFTSAGFARIPENSDGAIYAARAVDPDGDRLSLTVAGGADAARFAITDDGALRFATPPNFEYPDDLGADNVYEVVLAANDGDAVTRFPVRLQVTNAGRDRVRVRRVATGFAEPLFLAPVPDGSGRVYVVEKGGLIRILDPETGNIAPTPFFDISAEISTDFADGLLGFATAPDFATSRTFYVYFINLAGDSELRSYRVRADNPDRAKPDSADTILAFDLPAFDNHHAGGWLAFSPLDGFLYLATGDGGGEDDPNNTARDLNLLLGKMLRIDPSGDDFPGDDARDYAIPADNPFAGGGGRPEIWAYGLRNPFRCSFDRETGLLYIADVGKVTMEEIDLMGPGDGGLNFGWSIFEGTSRFKPGSRAGLTFPVLEYRYGIGAKQGRSVIGGYVYRGPVEALNGIYLFGDFVAGNLWTVPANRLQQGVTLDKDSMTNVNAALTPEAGVIDQITSFGEDEAGNLYIVGNDGEVFIIEAAG